MSRLLAVLLSFLCPLGAAAQAPKRRRAAVVVPKTSLADKQAFEQTFEFVLLQAGKAYLKDEAMPDPVALDPFITSLKEPELGKAKGNRQRLEEVISGAEWVQQGPGSVSPEVYKLMVDQAADDLGVGSVVEESFVPNGRAGRSLDASEKSLVKDCQAEARDQAYDRRSFYQRCLGHRRAESVYLNPQRPAAGGDSQARSPAAMRLLQEIAANKSRLPAELSQDVSRKLTQTRDRLSSGWPASADAAVPASGPWGAARSGFRRLTPRPADTSFKQPDGLKTSEPPLNAADLSAGTKLARISKADEIGFTGYCYSYVKSALQKAGIVSRDDIAKAGAASHAKQFNEFVQKNPALLKRKLLRIPNPSWPLPIGTVVVWSPGACSYSAESGHIEIITRIKPPQACSDGCGTFQTACLDELSSDPARAAAELPAAQADFDQAQSAYDALTDRKARRLAAAGLSKRKAALAKVKSRLEPRVAAYVVQR